MSARHRLAQQRLRLNRAVYSGSGSHAEKEAQNPYPTLLVHHVQQEAPGALRVIAQFNAGAPTRI
jgi:hypothetical protein